MSEINTKIVLSFHNIPRKQTQCGANLSEFIRKCTKKQIVNVVIVNYNFSHAQNSHRKMPVDMFNSQNRVICCIMYPIEIK